MCLSREDGEWSNYDRIMHPPTVYILTHDPMRESGNKMIETDQILLDVQ